IPLIYINIILTFTISLLGILVYRSHLISSLLYLKKIILSLFIITTLTTLNTHSLLTNIIPITILIFTTYKTTINLTLLISISNTYGLDYVHNLNLLQY
ncbi:NU4LM oxidoreductase, partial [Chloropsis hardwickii]|nr:NU4LM oxidoreductase [Chloropsis hardwickii]